MSSIYNKHTITQYQNQIRLVHLSGGQRDDAVRCSLEVVPLDEETSYEALSYCWGDCQDERVIILDEEEFHISQNLLSALRTIRNPKETRTLWVDAICINQQDNLEKAWQVNLMGEIFANCQMGLIYLGEEKEKKDEWCLMRNLACSDYVDVPRQDGGPNSGELRPAEESILSFPLNGEPMATASEDTPRRNAHPSCQWHGRLPRFSTINGVVQMLSKGYHLHEIETFNNIVHSEHKPDFEDLEPVFALGAFLNRTWWTRSWTVQEAALPRSSTIYCGSLEYSFEELSMAAENLYNHSLDCCSDAFTSLAEHLDPEICYGEATINIFFNFQRQFNALDLARAWVGMPDINLLDLLYSFHNRQAKDERDKIYALLGFLPRNMRVQPDYTTTLERLNKSLSIRLLTECPDKQLSVLWRQTPPTTTRPSWIKNFSTETSAINRRIRSEQYDAGTKKSVQIKVCSDTELSVLGIKVDVLSDMGPDFRTAQTYSIDDFDSVRVWALFVHQALLRGKHHSTYADFNEIFGKTLSGNLHSLDPNYTGFTQVLDQFIVSLMLEKPCSKLVDTNLAQEVNISATGRRIFVTEQGRIGLGPKWMEEGDEVWVLFGSSVPFILRPLPNGRSTKHEHEVDPTRNNHIVVGDCYVDGIMFGEAVQETTAGQTVYLI